jgi:hypothetical protein
MIDYTHTTPWPIDKEKSELLRSRITPDDYAREKQVMLGFATKLHSIEEKSNCGSIKALDYIADFLEKCSRGLTTLAFKVRHLTVKISAPCAISFKKD